MEDKKKRVDAQVTKLEEAYNSRNLKYYAWLKNIITLAIGFLGIIVSLKSDKSENLLQHQFFVFTISSLAIGILCGAIVLYSEIYLLNQYRKMRGEYLLKVINDENTIDVQAINRPRIFDIFEITCFGFLTTSMITLVIYSSLSDYKGNELVTKEIMKTEISIP